MIKLSDLKRLKRKPWQRSKAATVSVDGRRSIKMSFKAIARLKAGRSVKSGHREH